MAPLVIQVLINPDNEVITTAKTFIVTSEVIFATGEKVVFVDIEEDSYNIEPQK